MARGTRAGLAVTAAVAGMLAAAGPAAGQGTTVGGSGSQYFLNDAFTGKANVELVYGEARDEVYAGDWDGNGTDTLLVRRGNTFHVRNSATSGPADVVFSYGDPGDTVLVGDWDGRGGDTLVVRRGNRYFVKNDLSTGVASGEFSYGEPDDRVLVGRWSTGQAGDTLGVRRGATYFLRYSLTSGVADRTLDYGEPTDTAFTGDWNGDGLDTLGVRRDVAAPPPAVPPNPGDTVGCSDFTTQAQAQEWFLRHYPYYGDVAELDADDDGEACESLP